MKKPILCLFVSTLLTPLSLFAQPLNYLRLGVNYSSFRPEGGKSEPGLTLGFGKDFYPIRSFNGFLGFNLNYATKKLKLENKTWPTNMQREWSDVEVGDVTLDRSYLESHTKLGYRFSLLHNKAAIGLFAGPLLSFPIEYSSRFLSKRTRGSSTELKISFNVGRLRPEEGRAPGTGILPFTQPCCSLKFR